MASLAMGGNSPIGGFLTSAVASGKALADNGEVYDSVQDAENAADSFVLVGPGTFNESVTVDTAGMTLVGSGYDTLIDGGTIGDAIKVTADNVTVRRLRVQTTQGAGNSYIGVLADTVSNCTITRVVVTGSDQDGIEILKSTDCIVDSCHVENTDVTGISVSGSSSGTKARRVIISNCFVDTTNDSNGDTIVTGGGGGCFSVIVANCIIRNATRNGIGFNGSDSISIGNRIINSGVDGVYDRGVDNIRANTRVSDSGSSDIDNGGSGTITDDIETGISN
jgi:hypothetical protein